MAEIAVRENITDNYVSNLIHLAWLSPDIVGRILVGDSQATALARAALLARKSDGSVEIEPERPGRVTSLSGPTVTSLSGVSRGFRGSNVVECAAEFMRR